MRQVRLSFVVRRRGNWGKRKLASNDRKRAFALILTGALSAAGFSGTARAQAVATAPSHTISFTIGNEGTTCEAQGVAMGDGRRSMFDRRWVILCSDAARAVGSAYSFRNPDDPGGRLSSAREEELACEAPAPVQVDHVGSAFVTRCRAAQTGLDWTLYTAADGDTVHAVEGLGAYDSALRLALASLVQDRVVPGKVSVANLGVEDRLAIIKARAAVLDLDTMIGQGYRGNSAGSYAEAAEIFAVAPTMIAQEPGDSPAQTNARRHELTVNRALQLSNLGEFDQAYRYFEDARSLAGNDPVQARLARNYEAIDALNRGDLGGALAILDRPVPSSVLVPEETGGALQIDAALSAGLNGSSGGALSGVLGQDTRLTPQERAVLIDAQAMQLRGIAQRLGGDQDAARRSLSTAYSDAMRVRDGRVTSIARLRAQTLSELALTFEAEGRYGEAEDLLKRSQTLVSEQYPDSASVNLAHARLAGFYARRQRTDEALALYGQIADNVAANQGSLVGMENVMRPYFDLLTQQADSDAAKFDDLFLASQLVERPGAADTLAQLSRQLETGDDEAAEKFRRSLALSREIERNRMRLAQLTLPGAAADQAQQLADLNAQQERLIDDQVALLAELSEYPQYRAVANRYTTLAELRESLRPGEAYLKLVDLAGTSYALLIAPDSTRAWQVEMSSGQIAEAVATLRDSISVTVNGIQSTYPFDIDAALALHEALFAPVSAELASVSHLVFEPDGALLQLPVNLLTGDRAGVAAYHARVENGGDEYDFTGIDWLGRKRAVSTSLSAAGFRDARQAPGSDASLAFLGLGDNVPLGEARGLSAIRASSPGFDDTGCNWPVTAWNHPISATELKAAQSVFGQDSANLMTGPQFTDAAILTRPDLDNYRVLHFATHGLVTPPADGCPARPALLTSVGQGGSDGLLSFREIFDLDLDANLVVLSACDTASQASLDVTREAGITSGGGQALDGLVRAFIAAGGRQVIASHWPAPDDYDATQRLFSGFYRDSADSMGDALRKAQMPLMDDPDTSHPFYWAGFAIVGDAARTITGR